MSKMIVFAHEPIHSLSKATLAANLVLWLCCLPVMLRIQTIPTLLGRLGGSEKQKKKAPMEVKAAVRVVTRVSNLRPFRSRFFPKRCLRQSLLLYRTLCRMGYPVEIHFGARKDGEDLHGHSWVTLHGKPVADTARNEIFKVLYSYPNGEGKMEIKARVQL